METNKLQIFIRKKKTQWMMHHIQICYCDVIKPTKMFRKRLIYFLAESLICHRNCLCTFKSELKFNDSRRLLCVIPLKQTKVNWKTANAMTVIKRTYCLAPQRLHVNASIVLEHFFLFIVKFQWSKWSLLIHQNILVIVHDLDFNRTRWIEKCGKTVRVKAQ